MASRNLFPPIVNSYEPAFVAGTNSSLRVYFSLSSLSNISSDIALTVHAQIYRQDGVKVLKTTNDATSGRYRATGIILNLIPTKSDIKDNYYYITINNSDLKSQANGYTGWIPGWTYKIQLRLSTVIYNPSDFPKQSAWLQEYSNSFSEWSTVCYTKAISPMRLQIPLFDYDNLDKTKIYNSESVYSLTKMDFFGTIESSIVEANEYFDYVTVSLYQGENLIEQSEEIYKVEQSNTYFGYQFKTNFIEDIQYTIYINYVTENGYTPTNPVQFNFTLTSIVTNPINAQLLTIDTNYLDLLTDLTCLDEEEDEGRICLKIYSLDTELWSGNICIRRSSQADNFQTWQDIKIFTVKQQDLNSLNLIYDYTIESGVWYKYGIQSIDKDGTRSELVAMSKPIQRLFNYSYIIGQGGKQLKLPYDNIMNSFKYQITESKFETIGSQYPFITRNAAVYYRTFPINALISFNMDDKNTFLTEGKKDLYNYNSVVQLYEDHALETGRYQYDYTYEKDFRQKVLNFLQDGKPKLFKSPTEGNIIVRLMDINCTPNQTLDRMIYSLSMNANEIDDNNLENYLKYGFFEVGTYSTDFSSEALYIGQLDGDFFSTDNIFKKIYEKYDSQGENYGGYTRKLKSIQRVIITINGYNYLDSRTNIVKYLPGHQLRIYNNQGNLVLGNNMKLNYSGSKEEQTITIYDPRGIYEFDSLLVFYYTGAALGNDSLYLMGDAEGSVVSVNATIDFVYELNIAPYEEHSIQERHSMKGISQFFGEVKPDTSIYNLIYYQHYINSNTIFKYLSQISSIEIEANPHTVFAIQDETDDTLTYYEINETGVLRLYNITDIRNIKYIGKRYLTTPYDESTVSSEIITEDILDDKNHYILKASADVSILYSFTDVQGTYKQEI